jgi:hypothetical protein
MRTVSAKDAKYNFGKLIDLARIMQHRLADVV